MGFIPSLPAQSRNGRPALRPVFVRPSGEGRRVGGPVTAAGVVGLSIANMPPGGNVYVDGNLLSTRGGRWQGTTWLIPFSGTMSRIHITNADESVARGEDVPFGTVTEFDWNTLPAVDATPIGAGPLRIRRMPHGGTVLIDGEPVGGRWVDPATMREWEITIPDRFSSLVVRDAAGNERALPSRGDLRSAGGVFVTDWEDLQSTTATLRLVGPHAGIFVDGEWRGHASRPESAGTEIWRYDVPVGARTIRVTDGTPSGFRDYNLTFAPGAMQQIVFVPPSAAAPPTPPRAGGTTDVGRFADIGMGAGVGVGTTAPVAVPVPLTIVGPRGWQFVLSYQGSTAPLTSATIPAAGSLTIPVEVRSFDLRVNDGVRPPVVRTITVPPGGATVDLRAFYDAPTGPAPTPVRTGIVVIGGPRDGYAYLNGTFVAGEWLDAEQTRKLLPSPPVASVTLQVKNRDGSVVRQGPIGVPADRQQEVLYDRLPLLPGAGAPPAGTPRNTQGNTTASPTLGTILLSGAPPQSTVRVAGLADYVVNDSLLPVALDVPPGTVGVTVIPPGGVQRSASVPVTVGATTELAYGSMATPSNVEVAVGQCGLIPAPPPGVPESVCEGVVYPATDGTRWLGVMREGKVGLVRQVDVPTPTVVAEGRPWGLYALAAVAIGGGAWWWMNRDEKESKTENPGKKCSCQRH